MNLKETLENAKGEALVSLIYGVIDNKTDIKYIKEISGLHSELCYRYHEIIINEIEEKRYKVIGSHE